ncbi:MAG: radical SAM protein [Candidatus Gracilibacteria bacterium]|nr:radical SAM protein [Candidatus Gracilibacteria bacterium]
MGKDIKDLDGLEIFLGYKCSIRCYFCYQKDLRTKYIENLSIDEVINLLDCGYKEGKRFVIFSGGEPTLDSNLGLYIEYSKHLGFEHIRVHTNGYGLKDFKYLRDLYNRGLTGVTISVHGYDEVYERVSQVKGSFNTIKKALKNLEILKKIDNSFVFDTNTVVSKQNYRDIPKIVKFLCNFSLTRGQIVLAYSLDLFTIEEKKEIIPEYNEIVEYLKKTLKIAYIYNKKFVLENIPFCVIDRLYWNQIINNIKINKESVTIREGNLGNTNLKWMKNLDECKKCNMNKICRGLPKDYYEVYGDSCIKPIYD